MMTFLQQIGAKGTPEKPKMTRQMTLDTAFARINARSDTKDASSTPSLTTGTSLTDNSSELNDESSRIEDTTRASGRPRASTESIASREITVNHPLSPRRKLRLSGTYTTSSSGSLTDRKFDSNEALLPQHAQAALVNPKAAPAPRNVLKRRTHPRASLVKRAPPRPGILQKASDAITKAKTSLGKRRRQSEDDDDAVDEETGLYGMKTSRLRSREQKAPPASIEQPAPKKARFSQSKNISKKSVTPEPVIPRRKPRKIWLSQGLYVGQERHFKSKMTESENNLRKTLVGATNSKHKPILPLPMFAGERLLEHGRNFKLPFNIFSPLPPGQPKPDEWKKTQKNVFIGDAADVWKHNKQTEYSACICDPEAGCDENCLNHTMFYECDDNNCNVGEERCKNRAFAGLKLRQKAGGKYNIGVEVMKTADRGYGIRANRTFEPNQIIVEYTGEIITQEECESRMRGRYKDAECYYLMDFDQSMILDATRGSIARFVNHSCSPNCRMVKWTVMGKPRMALFAGDQGIMTGEELTYDYNFNPYSIKNVQACRCGADNCRGVLGPKPKDIKDALNPIANGGKRKIQQVVEDAMEEVKNAAKKRKLNVPSSVKNVLAKTKESVIGGSSATKKSQEDKKKGAGKNKKPLPLGWVYVDEVNDAPPPVIRNIFQNDPEKLMRNPPKLPKRRSSVKVEEKEAEANPLSSKKRKSFNGTSVAAGKFSEDLDDDDEDDDRKDFGVTSASKNKRGKMNSVSKNVVRTIKGRGGGSMVKKTKTTTTTQKSIRVIASP